MFGALNIHSAANLHTSTAARTGEELGRNIRTYTGSSAGKSSCNLLYM